MWQALKEDKSKIDFQNLFWLSNGFFWRGDPMHITIKDTSIRNEVLSELVTLTQAPKLKKLSAPKLNVLVIDDDPLFLQKVRRAASRGQIAVTECSSLDEVDAVALAGVFDVAIVDYYLDGMRRELRGPTLAKRLGPTPTILVSQNDHCVSESDPWPGNVRFFINKCEGPNAVLQAALEYKR
jgi:hypothetical protein